MNLKFFFVFRYTTGLLQTAWLDDNILTPSFASLVNSLTFTLTLIPAPIFQRILDKLGFKPYSIAALALPLLLIGSIWSSVSSDDASMLISNGIMVGLGCSIQLVSCWNGLYYMFTDNQIFLFNGFMLAGAGLGIVPASMLFFFVKPIYGWRVTQRLTTIMYLSLVIFAFTLLPPVRKFLGIKTRDEKLSNMEPLLDEPDSDHHTNPRSNNTDGNEGELADNNEAENDATSNDEDVPTIALTSIRSASMQQEPAAEEAEKPVKYVLTNVGYILATSSYVLTATAYDTIMVHQPVRMKSLDINANLGALALIINGSIQAVMRVSVGILTANNVISAARLSQIAKIYFFVSTAISLFVTDQYYQTAYFFSLGFSGAILNTADFFLIKETLKKHRDFAVVLELSIAGILTFITMNCVGILYQHLNSYDVPFYILTSLFVLGVVPSFLYEVEIGRKNRAQESRRGYNSLN